MQFEVTMTDKQQVAIGCTIVDQDGQPFEVLPDGASISFVSDNPEVANVTVREDGLNADVSSGKVGSARITMHASGLKNDDGSDLVLPDDVLRVLVRNSVPGALNTTIGAPTDEIPG